MIVLWGRRITRRRKTSRGFTLIEALVALTVSAMTLALLASAGFGLQQARESGARNAGPIDQIIARRVLHEWAGAATKSYREASGAFEAEETRLALRTAQGEVMRLSIETDAGISTLIATRAGRLRDVRMIPETARASTLMTVEGDLRFSYLVLTGLRGQTRDWAAAVEEDAGLPLAVALEIGNTRIAMAPVVATASGPCMVGYGMSENGAGQCALR